MLLHDISYADQFLSPGNARNSFQRQTYFRKQRSYRRELQVLLAREVVPVKGAVLRDKRRLDGSP
jgi:hypothetical protein